jgi:hypothetical protein
MGYGFPPVDGRGQVLHVSDTPSCLYGFLGRAIRTIRPSWIVHTGDLADEIKLELLPCCRPDYAARVRKLLQLLESSGAEVYLFMGNHDAADLVRSMVRRSRVFEGAGVVRAGELSLTAAHDVRDILENPGPINLFGHDRTLSSGSREGQLFLNGVEALHLISAATGRTLSVPYPWGTDDARLLRRGRRL